MDGFEYAARVDVSLLTELRRRIDASVPAGPARALLFRHAVAHVLLHIPEDHFPTDVVIDGAVVTYRLGPRFDDPIVWPPSISCFFER